jgi:hypothetical protein
VLPGGDQAGQMSFLSCVELGEVIGIVGLLLRHDGPLEVMRLGGRDDC